MHGLDLLVIAAYAAAVLALGRAAGRGQPSELGLLLADRSLPTWAVLGSMIATELSAATFIGVPQAAYVGDWSYLQLAFGALAAKLLLAAHVIPLYHRLGVVTVYGFLATRFGPHTQWASAVCFAVGRTVASAARLFIAALAFSAVTAAPIEWAILGCALVAGVYTRWGGLRAVVWTDVLQGFVFAIGAAAVLVALAMNVEGGAAGALAWARREGRTLVFHGDPWFSLTDGSALGSALVAGFFLTLATHSTDHDMVQRLLAARDGRRGGRALWISALANFPLTALFLAIGTGIAYAHATSPPLYDGSDSRQVLPLFALHELPAGVRGLVFAGLFAAAMSSLDSAICAIASTWVSDIAPRTHADPVARLRRVSTWTCAALAAAALAMAAYQGLLARTDAGLPTLVEFALSAMGVLYGGLLGVFAVGIALPARGRDASARVALACGSAIGLALFLHPLLLGRTLLAWGYWIPLSAGVTALIAAARPRTAGARKGGRATDRDRGE